MCRRVAMVTGGHRGLGRGITRALQDLGFAVSILGRAESCDLDALYVSGDLSKGADRERFLSRTLEAYGRVDILVNNAGVAPDVRADLLDMTEASFDRVMGINLKGTFFLTQAVARAMIQQPEKGRCIINIGSISADTASIMRGEYCMSKAGLTMATQLFAARLAEHGINVYELRPGIMRTDMTAAVEAKYDALIREGLLPIPRWGTPEDVGLAVAALAEGRFPYSTGEVIHIDGGFHVRRL